MSAIHVADTGIFLAMGSPSNQRYRAVRRFARRNEITFVLPERDVWRRERLGEHLQEIVVDLLGKHLHHLDVPHGVLARGHDRVGVVALAEDVLRPDDLPVPVLESLVGIGPDPNMHRATLAVMSVTNKGNWRDIIVDKSGILYVEYQRPGSITLEPRSIGRTRGEFMATTERGRWPYLGNRILGSKTPCVRKS